MTDIIAAAILVLILTTAALYVRRAKKRGVKCIGCPEGGSCAGCGGANACGCHADDAK